ncbi:glucarate dehydratase [Actinobacteria bacterium YIM 96077]|uniref:glucarate dehydratase n=1 Tax=Phytoactinopolyspora halophila TaxID=1981511 RepID=A0A329QPI9_9ACTN|nr:glucarate dehydratase family protein [Phytoactinopolyspora halophila]AYY12538.1 glucarate dehydratase [Actinobacteria bacterium YIM 96077]RAW12558.1 glucarate dehydratase [Phytoactinopolyspora halophila]
MSDDTTRYDDAVRVTGVTITPAAFPDPPLLNSVGVHQPWALRAVVEVHTAGGLVGLGETYGDAAHLSLLSDVAATLTGLDAYDIAGLARRVTTVLGTAEAPDRHGLTGHSSPSKTAASVIAAFETALLDLQGQAAGRPVYALLGGKYRDHVPFAAYLFYKWAAHPGAEPDGWGEALDPDGVVAQARGMIDRYGFRSIKLKGGVFEPAEEIGAVRALRHAFPGHPLRLDPNCAWTVDTSVRVARETDGLLEYLEDPTPGIGGMARVAERAAMPLATNMCVVQFADLPEAFERGAVQIVLADHHYWGGLHASIQLAKICETWGVGVSMHSNSHLGISLAAMTHLAAATPVLQHAVDTHLPWQEGNDVVQQPLRIIDGAVQVPGEPGLGVRLDPDALARMHENYLTCGIRERDDTTYMQRFHPEFELRRPRW